MDLMTRLPAALVCGGHVPPGFDGDALVKYWCSRKGPGLTVRPHPARMNHAEKGPTTWYCRKACLRRMKHERYKSRNPLPQTMVAGICPTDGATWTQFVVGA